MSAASFFLNLLPHAIAKWLLARRQARPCWQGIYHSFAEVPAVGTGYDDRLLAEEIKRDMQQRMAQKKSNNLLLNLLCGTFPGSVKVIDWGGGQVLVTSEWQKN